MNDNRQPTAAPTAVEQQASLDALFRELSSSPEGLTGAEARTRLEKNGPNALEEKHPSALLQFLGYFWGPIPWMIEVAAVLSAIVGHWMDLIIISVLLVVVIMLGRVSLLQFCLAFVRHVIRAVVRPLTLTVSTVHNKIEQIQSQQMVFFTRGDNIANLNRVMLYIQQNEHTNRIKLVHVTNDPESIPDKLRRDIALLDEAYPDIDVEFVVQPGTFGPELIQQLSREWHIPPNFMFIGCPGEGLPHSLAELGGVRVIV